MKHIGWCLLCLLIFSSGTAWADIVIIAHPKVAETTITAKEVQEIFLGNRVQWKDNSAIRPATLKDPQLHDAFLKQYIKKSASQWVAHWKRQVFTGNGTPPPQFATPQELVHYVAETPGAIGYVDAATPVENVLMLTIQE